MSRSLSFCFLLVVMFLIGATPQGWAEGQLTQPQQQQVEQIIHDYLINNPSVLIEAIKRAEAREQQEADQRQRELILQNHDRLFRDPNSPIGGNQKGDVTIVEFFDYRCPYCKQVEPTLEALLKEDPKLRIIYKEFPILGPVSVEASHVALAALKQGEQRYLQFHNAMMAMKGQITDETVMQVASDAGLDTDKIKADMKAPEIDAELKSVHELAETLKITGTPAFVVDGMLAPGAMDIDTLRKLVADARKSG